MSDSIENGGGRADRIDAWLSSVGFEQYAELFDEQQIDFDILPDITGDDLRELGIPLGDRKRLLRSIAALFPDEDQAQEPQVIERADTEELAVERRHLTIAFCDLVGSTDLAGRLDPEEMGEIIRDYKSCCLEIMERWQGKIAKFLGDGILVLFGWPKAREDDAERAIHAALELTAAVGRLRSSDGEALSARVGIATGLSIIGDVGVSGVIERDSVVGATPNLAARVQSIAEPGEVAIAPQTRHLVGQRFDLESLGDHQLKGIPEPVEIWRVKGVQSGKNRFEAKIGNTLSPMIGRQEELDKLAELWRTASAGTGQSILITGEAGIGKSRLLQALTEQIGDNRVLNFQCLPYYSDTALSPIIERLNSKAGITPGASPEERIEKLRALLDRWGLDIPDAFPLLAMLLSIPLGDEIEQPDLSPMRLRKRTLELLIDMIEYAGSKAPMLVIFEDLHWADPTTLDLLEPLMARVQDSQILLVMSSRTPILEGTVERMDLPRLPSETVEELVGQLVVDAELPPGACASITASAEGIPLFVEELTRTFIESYGPAGKEHGRGETVPAGLTDLLASRLDSLPESKEIAFVSAVFGRPISLEQIERLVPTPADQLERQVSALCDAGIFSRESRPDGNDSYFFRHALVREVAYHSQLKQRRRELHGHIATALEEHYPTMRELEPAVLGRHYIEAGQVEPGANLLLEAGSKALQSSALKEAIANLSQGLDAIQSLPPARARDQAELRLQATLGTAHMQAKGWASDEVEKAYSAAGRLSYSAGSISEAIWVLWGTWVYHLVRGRIADASSVLGRIKERAEEDSDNAESKIVADMIALQVGFYAGQFDQSSQTSRSFLERYQPEAHGHLTESYSTDLEIVCLTHYSINLWVSGEIDQSIELAERADRLLDESEHPHTIAWGHTWSSLVPLFRGQIDRVSEKLSIALPIAKEQGFAYVAAMATMLEGWIDSRNGHRETGCQKIEKGLDTFCTTGAEITVPFFKTLHAEILFEHGDHLSSLMLLGQAGQQIERWGETWQEPEVHRVRGKVLAACQQDYVSEAERSFRLAAALAEKSGAHTWFVRASLDLARHLLAQQKPDQAREALEPTADLIAKMSRCPEAEAAQALLAELSEKSFAPQI